MNNKTKSTTSHVIRESFLDRAAEELEFYLSLSNNDLNEIRKQKKASFIRLKILIDLFCKEDPKASLNELEEAKKKPIFPR